MSEVRYERLLPHQIVQARNAHPLAYLPIGTVEWHGLHNPLGLDTLKAHALCVNAARQGGGLVMPPLWWGEHREIQLMEANPTSSSGIADLMDLPPENFASGYMGGKSVEEQAHFYNDLLFHIYHQLASLGFKAIFVLCGHYPLQIYADYTASIFMRESPVRVFGATEAHLVSDLAGELGGNVGDHAGRWETSVLMALHADLVDLDRLPPDSKEALVGIGGEDPRQASEEFGQRAVEAIVERMVSQGQDLLDEAD